MRSLLLRRRMTMGPKEYIQFADPAVEAICVANWSSDGVGLTKADAAAVTNIDGKFFNNNDITSFNEFQYFTGITSMWYNAFNNCPNLTEITLPDAPAMYVRDARAFGTNSNLVINLPRLDLWFEMMNRSTVAFNTDSAHAFDIRINGVRVESVTVPSGYSSTKGFFTNWAYIKGITVESGIVSIGDYFAANCPLLEQVSLPSSVTSIGNNAFYNAGTSAANQKQSSLNLPNLLAIDQNAFFTCNVFGEFNDLGLITDLPRWAFLYAKFDKIVLPASLLTVSGDRALCSYVSQQQSVLYSLATTPPTLAQSAYDGTGTYRAVYVPAASVEDYKAAQYWGNYPSIIQAITT